MRCKDAPSYDFRSRNDDEIKGSIRFVCVEEAMQYQKYGDNNLIHLDTIN